MDTIPNLLHRSPGVRAIYACRGRTTDFGQLDAKFILKPVIWAVSIVLARRFGGGDRLIDLRVTLHISLHA